MTEWTPDFLGKLAGLHWNTKELTAWVKSNRELLERIGRDGFRSFLLLLQEGKNEQAFFLVLAKMDAEEILVRMEDNAEQLCRYNTDREEFGKKLMEFAYRVLLPRAVELALLLM